MMQYQNLEGQTPLDEEEKLDLIPSILLREDLNAFEQQNIIEARAWIMQKTVFSRHDLFSEKFLLLLHQRMYRNVWRWAGKYRRTNKNIGCDYYVIQVELRKLLDDVRYWINNKTFNMTELAIRTHHRLVKIHLFPNGNGRHARLYADVIIAKYRGDKLTWGSGNNLVKPDVTRNRYIEALRLADIGDYKELFDFARS